MPLLLELMFFFFLKELNKEKGIEPKIKIRKHITDEYKETIIDKLETIPGITTHSIYYFLKVEKNYKGSYESTLGKLTICSEIPEIISNISFSTDVIETLFFRNILK